jgi:elongation factor G
MAAPWQLQRLKAPAVLFAFKTVIEPRAGHVTLFKVMSGEVTEGMDLVNDNTGGTERINQLFIVDGKERKPVQKLVAGDIGGTIKLKAYVHRAYVAHARQSDQAATHRLPRAQIAAHDQGGGCETGGETACGAGGDPERGPHRGVDLQPRDLATTGRAQGELHLNLLKWKLSHHYKVEAEFGSPRIPYRETIRKPAEASYRHKKQTGGSGQFGEVHLRIEPWYEGSAGT